MKLSGTATDAVLISNPVAPGRTTPVARYSMVPPTPMSTWSLMVPLPPAVHTEPVPRRKDATAPSPNPAA